MPKVTLEDLKGLSEEEIAAKLKAIAESVSPVDALIELAEELFAFEARFGMKSSEFYEKFLRGEMGDDMDGIRWAGRCELFLHQRRKLEVLIMRAAECLEERVAA